MASDELATGEQWIQRLQLIRHAEGGYYRETYRSGIKLPAGVLPSAFGSARSLATTIYYLLRGDDFSAWHRLRSDEMWHFYAGSSLLIYQISPEGQCTSYRLGHSGCPDELPQCLVPAGYWIAAKVGRKDSFSLVGCTVSPGFEFADFEVGRRDNLLQTFPEYRDIILSMTRAGKESDSIQECP
jgi:predicted cupin superfamily sugar epimerase